ncbi:hypothetical protein EW146_g9776 [Bondarzewia mesenterica]|uniref:Uncharacterized protein n=1 Tax=Bondarzewia mesenterica TaxID=1095465 RepID=A0A4S4L3X7_9AGAM|nr:hypothetical protein EW146_g9776 [Bondarzewia mesenterica]
MPIARLSSEEMSTLSTPTQHSISLLTGAPPTSSAVRPRPRRLPPKPTTVVPPLCDDNPCVPFLLFGFLLKEDFLDAYCRAHDLGPVDTMAQKPNSYFNAITKIKMDGGVWSRSVIKTVYTGELDPNDVLNRPDTATCLVLGNNRTERLRRSPGEAVIKKVQAAMGVDTPPMWFKRA